MLQKLKQWWNARQNEVVVNYQGTNAKLILRDLNGDVVFSREYECLIIEPWKFRGNWRCFFADGDEIAKEELQRFRELGFVVNKVNGQRILFPFAQLGESQIMRKKFKFGVQRNGKISHKEFIDKDYI